MGATLIVWKVSWSLPLVKSPDNWKRSDRFLSSSAIFVSVEALVDLLSVQDLVGLSVDDLALEVVAFPF